MSLVNVTSADSYEAAAAALENAGFRRDGIPAGHTWRSAAKLTDADLIAGLKMAEIGDNHIDRDLYGMQGGR